MRLELSFEVPAPLSSSDIDEDKILSWSTLLLDLRSTTKRLKGGWLSFADRSGALRELKHR